MEKRDINKLNSLVSHVKNNLDTFSQLDFIIVFGPMGSGKSTFIRNNILCDKKVHVSIDEYINDIYSEEYTVSDMYRRVRMIGTMFTDVLMDLKVSMIVEGTGQGSDMCSFLHRLKEKNYRINMYIIDTPLDVCIKRVKARNVQTTRKISIDSIKTAHKKLQEHKEQFKQYATQYHVINTTNGYKFNTVPVREYGVKLDEGYLEVLCEEKSLQNVSVNFAQKHSGVLTKKLIATLENDLKFKTNVIQITTGVYELGLNCICSLPGWNTSNFDDTSSCKYAIFILKNPTIELIRNRDITINTNMLTPHAINSYINNMNELSTYIVPEATLVILNSNELLRYITYDKINPIAQYIFYASIHPQASIISYKNKINTQMQVYVKI